MHVCIYFVFPYSGLFYTHCRYRKLMLHHITLNDTHTHFMGLPWTRDRPIAEPSYLTSYHADKRQISMPPGGIRTRSPSKRAAADPRLRPRGHWDRQGKSHAVMNRLAQSVILLSGRCPIRVSTGTHTDFTGFLY